MAGAAGAAGATAWGHTCLTVGNLDAARAFYCAAFGYEPFFEVRGMSDEIRSMVGRPGLACDLAQLRSPLDGHVLELLAFDGEPDGPEPASPTRVGAGHVAFVVADLDAALAAVERLGATRLGAVTSFSEGRSVYLRDPTGGIFELSEGAL